MLYVFFVIPRQNMSTSSNIHKFEKIINLQLICEYFVKAHILTQSHEKDIQRNKFYAAIYFNFEIIF